MSTIKFLITGLVGVMLVVFAGLGTARTEQVKILNRAVIKIDSLSCGGCFSTISAGLSPLEGYSGMGANLFRKLIAVDFTAPLTKEEISKILSEVGYPGQVQSVDAISEKESFAYLESQESDLASRGGGSCCRGGGPVGNANQDSKRQVLPAGGSCCSLPDVNTTIPGKAL
ncbi:MAG: heavy-metal-associated domain-containing protein [Pseudomonadota bacterium]